MWFLLSPYNTELYVYPPFFKWRIFKSFAIQPNIIITDKYATINPSKPNPKMINTEPRKESTKIRATSELQSLLYAAQIGAVINASQLKPSLMTISLSGVSFLKNTM